MLTDLNIRNFAIIENLHVSFGPGLTVLTGETGAGKSIIIDAVNLILGGRASGDLIRNGAEEATVEAIFDVKECRELAPVLADLGIECDGDLLVKRVVSRSGKNRVFIGGGLATIGGLADLSRRLINIYGQHESQTLLKTENHLILLDGYAGLSPLRSAFTTAFEHYRALLLARQQLEAGEQEALRRIDLLSFQEEEIGKAALSTGEEEDLTRERQLLAHTERLLLGSQGAFERLYGADGSIVSELQRLATLVGELAGIDETLTPLSGTLVESAIQLEDVAFTLRNYSSRIEAEPARLQAVEDRLDLINRLKRKYGADVEAILAYGTEVSRELEHLLNRERTKGELDGELEGIEAKLASVGEELTRKRREGGAQLKRAMELELAALSMPHAVFEVNLESMTEPRSTGMERVEFFFSPNPGETPRPLAKTASGGELSRLMLALKQVHPESDVATLVFDEVDTGIGGATSATVGAKLRRVGQRQQVLCITHLPQVAAFADHHFRVEKLMENGRTVTAVSHLAGEDRVREMARMLGGAKVTETTLAHAREMIEASVTGA